MWTVEYNNFGETPVVVKVRNKYEAKEKFMWALYKFDEVAVFHDGDYIDLIEL